MFLRTLSRYGSVVILFCAVALASVIGLPAHVALADGGPKLEVQWGLGGRPRTGTWAPLVIQLSGTTQEMDVVVRVDPAHNPGVTPDSRAMQRNQPDLSQPYVERAVHLAAGARQQIVVWVPARVGWAPQVQVRAGGQILAEKTQNITADFGGATGLILAPETDLTTLGAPVIAGRGAVRWGRIPTSDLPGQVEQLAGTDVIVFGRVDTRGLTAEQKQALIAWVGNGGHLILVGGPEAATALAGVPPELMPVTLQGQGTADLSSLLALDVATTGTKLPAAPGPIAVVKPTTGSAVAAGTEQLPLAVRRQVGLGSVLFLAADPGLAPLGGNEHIAGMLTALLPPNDTGSTEEQGDLGVLGQFAAQMGALRTPPGGILLLLLLGYLVLLGPVQYLVLKRLDRRELIWIITPVLSLALLGISWVSAAGGRRLITTANTVTQLAAGIGVGTEQEVAGFFSPDRRKLDVKLPAGALVMAPSGYWNGDTDAPLWNGDLLHYESLSTYQPSALLAARPIALQGSLSVTHVRVEDGKISAVIENGTGLPLADVALANTLSIRDPESVGDLAPGEKKEIEFDAALLQVDAGWQQNRKPFQLFSMNMQGPVPEGEPSPWMMDQLARYAMQNSMAGGRSHLWLIARTTQLPQPWGMSLPHGGSGTNLLVMPVVLRPAAPASVLPAGMVAGGVVDAGVQYPMNGVGMLDVGQHRLQFVLPPLQSDLGSLHLILSTTGQSTTKAQQVRNWRTNAWDPLADGSAAVADHVGPGGLVQVQFISDGNMTMPFVSLTVEGGK